MEKSDIVPVFKKEVNTLDNHRPISLLPICSKILKRILFNSVLYRYLGENNFLCEHQSGFQP